MVTQVLAASDSRILKLNFALNCSTMKQPSVFVLMSFNQSLDDVYQFAIKPACLELGCSCERVDEQIYEEGMLERICNQIEIADYIVADMTGQNPNVFYEVGFAHALKKRVILLTQKVDEIPFDLKHHAHVIYGGSIAKLKTDLLKRLTWMIQNPRKDRVLELARWKPPMFESEWSAFLQAQTNKAAIDSVILGWAKSFDARFGEDAGHNVRVADLSESLGRHLNLDEAELVDLRRGALLHDIGKIGISDYITKKPTRLTVEEIEILKQHTIIGYELLRPIPDLGRVAEVAYCHHERWDGRGYPRGLKALEIPKLARIFQIVDVWDALITPRPYKTVWPKDESMEAIRNSRGTMFDPDVVDNFIQLQQG